MKYDQRREVRSEVGGTRSEERGARIEEAECVLAILFSLLDPRP
jgi:hypothetical protein